MSENARRIGLVGCVKQKAGQPAPACDLYTSTLFRGRRAFVEGTCNAWFILSAKHGLVSPDAVLEPYDESLTGMSVATRRAWAVRVLAQIDSLGFGPTQTIFEIHAGARYRSFGLVSGLQARGARVEVVAEHLGQGEQLAFYSRPASRQAGPVPTGVESRTDRARSGSYDALATHLLGLSAPTVTLTFTDLECLLGRTLPASARAHRAWWSNERSGAHTHARAWMGVGWMVDRVDLRDATVTFRRDAS